MLSNIHICIKEKLNLKYHAQGLGLLPFVFCIALKGLGSLSPMCLNMTHRPQQLKITTKSQKQTLTVIEKITNTIGNQDLL